MNSNEEKNFVTKKLETLKKIIEIDDAERLNISYKLNENIAQMLAAINLHINLAKKKITFEDLTYIEEAERILKYTLSEVRLLASSISPIDLKNIGFVNLLEELVMILENHHEIKCNVNIDAATVAKCSISNQNILYQIAQIQIINILKCKKVNEVFINIDDCNGFTQLTIKDDGKRLDIAKLSINLAELKLRIEAFDGSFEIIEQTNTELLYIMKVTI